MSLTLQLMVFDDCQELVKDLFNINNKQKKINLAAVNSINWVRIMGQIVYYLRLLKGGQWF